MNISLPVLKQGEVYDPERAESTQVDPIEVIRRFPLRVSVTDHCNADCFFCSNDGLGYERKHTEHVDSDRFEFLLNALVELGSLQVALSGGEPSVHPQAARLIDIVNSSGIPRKFYHTNGILLDRDEIREGLGDFTKVGVSIHAFDPEAYATITRLKPAVYQRVLRSLDALHEDGFGNRVEIKHVPTKGLNDSPDMLRRTLDYCSERGFRFKFLKLEAIEEDHIELQQDTSELAREIEKLGAVPFKDGNTFRGQTDYLPISRYKYGNTDGVVIDIGCGRPEVCASCYNANEIYLTPRLELKPCKASSHLIPLEDAIDNRNVGEIVRRIASSRSFLAGMPGLDKKYWHEVK